MAITSSFRVEAGSLIAGQDCSSGRINCYAVRSTGSSTNATLPLTLKWLWTMTVRQVSVN